MNLERSPKCKYYEELLEQRRFPALPHKRFQADLFDFKDIEKEGFDVPFVVEGNHSNFGLEVPPASWTLKEIASIIGTETPVRIIEVGTQSELCGFSIAQYADYLSTNRSSTKNYPNSRILNMISLEVSNTKLTDMICAPKFVDLIDWVSLLWPLDRIARNDYPRVQKYCLAGMAGAYTDFHIDFGGTSVWYHILWGRKRFFLIPPTNGNLDVYEQWTCSRSQSKSFLADKLPNQCFVLDLCPNETLIIPSGWIHAVYTPEDSLVFGGNFLCTFSILRQIQSYEVESRSRIDDIFLFPYFKQINLCFLINFYEKFITCEDAQTRPQYSTLIQLPVLLKEIENWIGEKKVHTDFEIFISGKPYEIETMLEELWTYLGNVEEITGSIALGDFREADSIRIWEIVIIDKISSHDYKALTKTSVEEDINNSGDARCKDEDFADWSESDDHTETELKKRKDTQLVSDHSRSKRQKKSSVKSRESLWNLCNKSKRK